MGRWWVMPLAVLAAAGVLGGGVWAGQQLLPGPEAFLPDDADVDDVVDDDGATVPDLVEFRDEDAGVEIALPEGWERLEPADPEIRLLATPNFRDSVLVRVTPMDLSEASFAELQRLTDEIVETGPDVEVLSGAQEFVADGYPGYHYLYTFFDEGEGERGVHSHFFVFREDALIAVVFQALPENRFSDLAPTFDAMAASLRLGGGSS